VATQFGIFHHSRHQSKRGSLVWNRIAMAWKRLLPDIQFVPPTCLDELLGCSLWYCPIVPIIGPGFSKSRAAVLHQAGMKTYRDIWFEGSFLPIEEVQRRFGLLPAEVGAWQAAMRVIDRTWNVLLRRNTPLVTHGDWYGFYERPDALAPFNVVKMCLLFTPRLLNGAVNIEVPVDVPTYVVQHQSAILQELTYEQRCVGARWDLRGEDLVSPISGVMRRVRVIPVTRGPKQRTILLYYGRVDQLSWDPARYAWNLPNTKGEQPAFMNYSAQLGRSLLRWKHVVPDVVIRKWEGVLAPSYRLRWAMIWDKERTRKEAGLIWLSWHKGVAVNEWRLRIRGTIPRNNAEFCCPVCVSGIQETVLHRFWECRSANKAWLWSAHILQLAFPQQQNQSQSLDTLNLPITWKHGIFSHRMPRRYKKVSRLWVLLRGIVIWLLWIERNEAAFDGVFWSPEQLRRKIWVSIIDYGRLAWQKLLDRCKRSPDKRNKLTSQFMKQWCSNEVFACWFGDRPYWKLTCPNISLGR
jgi:hypothetical protein